MSGHQELRERIAVAADKHAERLADAVLDALGLEQVGWFVRFPSGIEAIALAPFENDSDMGKQEPVYRLTGAAEGDKAHPGNEEAP